MVSEEGWVSDEAIFAKINTNLGEGYSWSSGPVLAGGGLYGYDHQPLQWHELRLAVSRRDIGKSNEEIMIMLRPLFP